MLVCVIGVIFGKLSVMRNRACRVIARIFVDVIRGFPLIVLMNKTLDVVFNNPKQIRTIDFL